MGLFSKKREDKLSILNDDPLGVFPEDVPAVNYNSVVDYLTGLSDKDYETVCKVAVIYRKAQAEAAKALGVENEPTTFITPPEPVENTELVPSDVNHIKPKTILDEDDDDADIAAILDEPDFIADEVPTNKTKGNGKAVDIEVKE